MHSTRGIFYISLWICFGLITQRIDLRSYFWYSSIRVVVVLCSVWYFELHISPVSLVLEAG